MNVKGYIKLTYLIVPHYNYTPLNVHSAQKSPIPNQSKWISLAAYPILRDQIPYFLKFKYIQRWTHVGTPIETGLSGPWKCAKTSCWLIHPIWNEKTVFLLNPDTIYFRKVAKASLLDAILKLKESSIYLALRYCKRSFFLYPNKEKNGLAVCWQRWYCVFQLINGARGLSRIFCFAPTTNWDVGLFGFASPKKKNKRTIMEDKTEKMVTKARNECSYCFSSASTIPRYTLTIPTITAIQPPALWKISNNTRFVGF